MFTVRYDDSRSLTDGRKNSWGKSSGGAAAHNVGRGPARPEQQTHPINPGWVPGRGRGRKGAVALTRSSAQQPALLSQCFRAIAPWFFCGARALLACGKEQVRASNAGRAAAAAAAGGALSSRGKSRAARGRRP